MMLDLPGEDQRDIRGMWWLRFGSIWGKDRSINCDVLKRSVISNYYGYWAPLPCTLGCYNDVFDFACCMMGRARPDLRGFRLAGGFAA